MSVKKNNSEIEQAVKKIPGLIYDEMHKKNTHNKTPIYISPQHSKKWLIIGVVIFSICIIALWSISVASVFYETKNKNSDNETFTMIKNGQTELQKIINTFSEKRNTTTTQKTPITTTTLKKILSNILVQTTTTTTSTNK